MTYLRHVPSPPLDTYLYDLYYLDGPAPYPRQKVLPMPSLHLMINLGAGFQVHAPDHAGLVAACTESWWVGLWSTYHIVDSPANARFFGVHVKPAGAYPFLQRPLAELHNQVVPLDALWGQRAAEIRERLWAAPTIAAGLAELERLLLAQLQSAPPGLPLVQAAVDAIARQHGTLSVRWLSDRLGISQNHLGTQFKRLVGLPPKALARCYRFAHSLRALDPAQPVDWRLIARQAHFYDQAHLHKDFVAFTGHSPSEYLQQRRQLQLEHPEYAASLGQLPID